jgi:glycosyltransferase involved in cell wall biosynthesis
MTRRRLIEGYGVTSPVSVIPTGVQLPPLILVSGAAMRRELGLPERARILLYVGRLAPEKNLDTLLDAFAIICRETSDTFLVLAGSGKSQSALKWKTEELGISGRTVFTGFVPRTRLDPLYRNAEVFVFPSKTETQGLVIGEALAAGTPCVLVNEGGAPESVHDGIDGFLVGDSASEIAERTLKILVDKTLRKKMSEQAKRRAQETTPERIAQQVIGVYESLLNGNAASTDTMPMAMDGHARNAPPP